MPRYYYNAYSRALKERFPWKVYNPAEPPS